MDVTGLPSSSSGLTEPESAPVMAHEIAKLLLEHAGTFLERAEAIETALGMGMPLSEIEEYLDWLDATRGMRPNGQHRPAEPPSGPEATPDESERPGDRHG